MVKTLFIATDLQTSSYSTVSKNIAEALANQGVACTVRHWMNAPDNIRNILIVGSCLKQTLGYLWRFDENTTNVIAYLTAEGQPIVGHMDIEAIERKHIRVIVPSGYVKECLEEIGIEVDAVIPHAIPMDEKKIPFSDVFYKDLAVRLQKTPNVVINVAHNNVRKALGKLLIAFKLTEFVVKDSYLILHSCDPIKGYNGVDIRMATADLALQRFWFTGTFGMLSEGKVNAMYKVSRILGYSSMAEGFGLPMIEAFRMGIPVVAVNAPPMNEIVKNGVTGILVPSKMVYIEKLMEMMNSKMFAYEIDDFASAMIGLLTEDELRKKMIANIQEEKWNWDADRVYSRFLEFIRD